MRDPLSASYDAWNELLEHEPCWGKLLKKAGLQIDADSKESFLRSLVRETYVDRSVPGFEDFAAKGRRGIEPGRPAYSLLYHAFASPSVVMFGKKVLRAFPTEEQIEALEDLVYATDRPSLAAIAARAPGATLGIAVFAYEYRSAPDTVHRCHADLCFARTGIARIGNELPMYLGHARGYLPSIGPAQRNIDASLHVDRDTTIRVIPCRYGAFVAALLKGDEKRFGPMRFQKHETTGSDSNRHFWVPLHKLFNGRKCIRDMDVNLTWRSMHVNEKIGRVHRFLRDKGYETGWGGTDLQQPPFRFQDGIADHQQISAAGGTVKVIPQTHKPLIKAAHLNGKPLAFNVQRIPNTYFTSLWLKPPDDTNYSAPEYVYARTRVQNGVAHDLTELREFIGVLRSGGYQAQHYVDFTGDGYIEARCSQLANHIKAVVPAYSLVAVCDFFPLVSQRRLQDWYDEELSRKLKQLIWSGDTTPQPLCDTRIPPNLAIEEAGFAANDTTVSAIVSCLDSGGERQNFSCKTARQTCLPDHAAGVMAPGWDTSQDLKDGVAHLAAYGLGSPFPEDQKLCAALSAFWPAATADTTRFYPQYAFRSTTPLPDRYAGWDGVELPKLTGRSGDLYEYASLGYVDYVKTALLDRFKMRKLADITFEQFAEWTIVMGVVHLALQANTEHLAAKWYVPEFEQVQQKDRVLQRAIRESGAKLDCDHTYRLLMFTGRILNVTPRRRDKVLVTIDEKKLVYADTRTVLLQRDGRWQKAYG